MKKLFVFALIMSMLFVTARAGYVFRGMNVSAADQNLKNYTLTVDNNGPVSAASTFTSSGEGHGRNSIVIIPADQIFPDAYFPISFSGANEDFDIEVRDFHYISGNNSMYVLCGSRETATDSRAFVAVIDGNLTTMHYNEYPEADVFYSIWAERLVAIPPAIGYYVCGKSGNHGVIASVDPLNLLFTNFYITNHEWEYHKIILKGYQMGANFGFIASGRNPNCTHIGFTVFSPPFNAVRSYMWEQRTNPLSHCVVSDNIGVNNAIILASSYQDRITLNPVTYPMPVSGQVLAYRFGVPVSWGQLGWFHIQDINTIRLNAATLRISVAGSFESGTNNNMAWHGYTIGLSATSTLRNNFYGAGPYGLCEHYKIRYDQQGYEFTGGYYQNSMQMCALFGTPLTPAPNCDYLATSSLPGIYGMTWSPFNLSSQTPLDRNFDSFVPKLPNLTYDDCPPFKGGEPALKSMPIEDESEIIALPDRITLSDIPANTNYQIYNTIGQLIQTGVTTPDISTVNLNKGVYILRLENGKSFKFVK